MNHLQELISTRKIQFRQFTNFLNGEADNFNWKTKFYFFEIPSMLHSLQETQFLIDFELFKEDYGTFRFLTESLKKNSESDIKKADYIIFPFNINFYEDLPKDLIRQTVSEIQSIANSKSIVMFSIGDFCFSSRERTTQFEKELFSKLGNIENLVFPFVREQDVILSFESTADLSSNNIPVFPLSSQEICPFDAKQKKFFVSFVGEYFKDGWSDNFIRGKGYKAIWDKMRTSAGAEEVIMTTQEAHDMFPDQNPFFELPKKSSFTLCPRGIASWTFRVFESIRGGSIPVILSDSYLPHFNDQLPWEKFSITVPEESLEGTVLRLRRMKTEYLNELIYNLNSYQQNFSTSGLLELLDRSLQFRSSPN